MQSSRFDSHVGNSRTHFLRFECKGQMTAQASAGIGHTPQQDVRQTQKNPLQAQRNTMPAQRNVFTGSADRVTSSAQGVTSSRDRFAEPENVLPTGWAALQLDGTRLQSHPNSLQLAGLALHPEPMRLHLKAPRHATKSPAFAGLRSAVPGRRIVFTV